MLSKNTFRARRFRHAIALALVSTALLMPVYTQAASLGPITMRSGADEPLLAEIRVVTDPSESNSLTAALASKQSHSEAGVPFPVDAALLQVTLEPRDAGTAAVVIRSTRPISQPKFEALIELKWDKGYISRPYLVDTTVSERPTIAAVDSLKEAPRVVASPLPADTAAAPATAPVTAPAIAPAVPSVVAAAIDDKAAPRNPPGRPRAVSRGDPIDANEPKEASLSKAAEVTIPRSTNSAVAKGADVASSTTAGSSVTVAKGQSLANIAAQYKDDDVALDRAMLAIFRANPNAFFGSIHQLKAGATLSVPSRETMLSKTDRFIAAEMRRHTEVFQAYKARAAGSPALASTDGPAAQTRDGRAAGSTPKYDRLVLSKSTNEQAAAEQRAAVDSALKEARSRIADLERNLGDLNKLAELKDRQIAQATATLKRLSQDTAAAAKPATATAVTSAAPNAAPNAGAIAGAIAAAKPAQSTVVTPAPSTPVSAASVATDNIAATIGSTAVATAAATPPAATGGADAGAAVSTATAAAKSAATELTKLPPVATAPRRTAVTPEPSLFDSIPSYLIYGLIGIIAAGGLWFGKRWKDQRAPKERFDQMVSEHSMFNTETDESYFTQTQVPKTKPTAFSAGPRSARAPV